MLCCTLVITMGLMASSRSSCIVDATVAAECGWGGSVETLLTRKVQVGRSESPRSRGVERSEWLSGEVRHGVVLSAGLSVLDAKLCGWNGLVLSMPVGRICHLLPKARTIYVLNVNLPPKFWSKIDDIYHPQLVLAIAHHAELKRAVSRPAFLRQILQLHTPTCGHTVSRINGCIEIYC